MNRVHNGFPARMRELRSYYNVEKDITYKEFAKLSGIQNASIRRYIAYEAEPMLSNMIKLCNNLKINPNWLLLGYEKYKPIYLEP